MTPFPPLPRWAVLLLAPCLFIDHKGVIRSKWVGAPGERAIDAALEKLIREAESAKTKPK